MRGNETPGRIVMNFCTGVGVHDVITSANFYDCRLWVLSVVGGQIWGFSIDSRCRPYNTLALPCECVIHTYLKFFITCKSIKVCFVFEVIKYQRMKTESGMCRVQSSIDMDR